jgi:hypothetical protein
MTTDHQVGGSSPSWRANDFIEWLDRETRRRKREKEVAALLDQMIAEERSADS